MRPNSEPKTTNRVVEHAALLQIDEQRRRSPVDLGSRPLDMLFEDAVMVPVAVIELDKPHAAFGQTSGEQAIRGKRPVAPLRAVQVQDVLGLIANVHQLRHARLHLEGHFVLADARGDLGIRSMHYFRSG